MSEKVEIPVPYRHVDGGFGKDWIAVRVGEEIVVINEAGEGSITSYTIAKYSKNPRVIATADAVFWQGIVGLTHHEDGVVSISHRFAGVKDRIPVDVWLDEPVPVLERTQLLNLAGVGGSVEFECIDCGEHIERERHQMDIAGMTPKRCSSCTFDRMAASQE